MTSHLANHPAAHGERKRLAALVGVSVRTLFEWNRRGGECGRRGRPPRSAEQRRRAREQVEPVWCTLARGHRGVGSVKVQLARSGQHVATRQVREVVRDLHRERAQREEQRIRRCRTSVKVLARDVLWSLDQMDFGRDAHGSVRALEVNDACTQRILDVTVGPPAQGNDVVRMLERALAQRKGAYPFVLQVDNGSENANALVRAWAAEHEVILVFNLPHTPQHNPRAERKNGELRMASGLDKPTLRRAGGLSGLFGTPQEALLDVRPLIAARLLAAWRSLDACTPRASLGNLTPYELDRIAPRASDQVCRARFYREVCEEQERIACMPCNARDRRKLVREATWCALEQYRLVKRTRGGLPVRAFKPEGIS